MPRDLLHYHNKCIYHPKLKETYTLYLVGMSVYQAISRRGYRLWEDPVTYADLMNKFESQQIGMHPPDTGDPEPKGNQHDPRSQGSR